MAPAARAFGYAALALPAAPVLLATALSFAPRDADDPNGRGAAPRAVTDPHAPPPHPQPQESPR